MRKIKLVISDMHISAGPRMPDGARNVLEDFFDDEVLIEFFQHYGGRTYADCQVELIVNGDFFNMLQVQLEEPDLPEMITEEVAVQQMERILAGHAELIEALWTFAARPHNTLTFIIGNHDAGLLFPAVQKLLHQHLGRQVRFLIDYVVDDIFITHGHQYEFIHNFDMKSYTRRAPDGREVLKIPWGGYFIIQFLNRMKVYRSYIDKIKPFNNYLRWAFWNDHRFFWRLIFGILRFWATNRFSDDAQRRREFILSPRRIANAVTHGPLAKTATEILHRTRYRIVIFGHSHEIDYQNVEDGGEYFNTGSWIEHVSLDVGKLGKSNLRPYVLIEYLDGKPRATMRNWIGSHRLHRELIP